MRTDTANPGSLAASPGFLKQPFTWAEKVKNGVHSNSFIQLSQTEKLKRHAIFQCLIADLQCRRFERDGNFSDMVFDLPKMEHSKNFGILEDDELFRLGVCPIPNFILNACVCQKLVNKFGDLSVCNTFKKIVSNLGTFWRLDIDESLSRNGLFLPLRARRDNLIYGLKVFRHPDDQRPFMLKTRGAVYAK